MPQMGQAVAARVTPNPATAIRPATHIASSRRCEKKVFVLVIVRRIASFLDLTVPKDERSYSQISQTSSTNQIAICETPKNLWSNSPNVSANTHYVRSAEFRVLRRPALSTTTNVTTDGTDHTDYY
jgi:hypothetical protein